jgi:hypothetical protein
MLAHCSAITAASCRHDPCTPGAARRPGSSTAGASRTLPRAANVAGLALHDQLAVPIAGRKGSLPTRADKQRNAGREGEYANVDQHRAGLPTSPGTRQRGAPCRHAAVSSAAGSNRAVFSRSRPAHRAYRPSKSAALLVSCQAPGHAAPLCHFGMFFSLPLVAVQATIGSHRRHAYESRVRGTFAKMTVTLTCTDDIVVPYRVLLSNQAQISPPPTITMVTALTAACSTIAVVLIPHFPPTHAQSPIKAE